MSGTVTLVHANALPWIAKKICSGLLMSVHASVKTKENVCQMNNGTKCLVNAAAQPQTQIALEIS